MLHEIMEDYSVQRSFFLFLSLLHHFEKIGVLYELVFPSFMSIYLICIKPLSVLFMSYILLSFGLLLSGFSLNWFYFYLDLFQMYAKIISLHTCTCLLSIEFSILINNLCLPLLDLIYIHVVDHPKILCYIAYLV